MEEKKIGFIGDSSSVEFFRVFGAEIFPVYTKDEAASILEKIDMSEYAVVFITEEVFEKERFQALLMDKKLMVIPSLKSAEGKGRNIVDELIKKATGMT